MTAFASARSCQARCAPHFRAEATAPARTGSWRPKMSRRWSSTCCIIPHGACRAASSCARPVPHESDGRDRSASVGVPRLDAQRDRAYQVLERLGAGGLGEVFRARDTIHGRTVVVKRVPSAIAPDSERARVAPRARKVTEPRLAPRDRVALRLRRAGQRALSGAGVRAWPAPFRADGGPAAQSAAGHRNRARRRRVARCAPPGRLPPRRSSIPTTSSSRRRGTRSSWTRGSRRSLPAARSAQPQAHGSGAFRCRRCRRCDICRPSRRWASGSTSAAISLRSAPCSTRC